MTKIQLNKRIAIIGGMCALVIILGVPGLHLGFIPLSATVSFTTMPVPVIIATIFGGLPGALITSTLFGLMSLLNAAVNPLGALDPLFVWPQLSILPRILFGVVAWGVWSAINTLSLFFKENNIKNIIKLVASIFTAFFSTVAHSWIVYAALFMFLGKEATDKLGSVGYFTFIAIRLPNTLTESAVTAVIVALIVGATLGVTTRKPKLLAK